MKRTTIFSPCRRYRYTLWREWDVQIDFTAEPIPLLAPYPGEEHYLMVIGLNPSTADETTDDPTIRRCIGFAKRWGFGALCMTNLFGFRATLPEVMKREPAPEGENDPWLRQCAEGAGMILAAWGTHGSHRDRADKVLALLHGQRIHALAVNGDGSPKHPLYVRADTAPIPFGCKP